MTAANFSACLKIVLENEGGFVDDSQDPGGATNLGVTLDTWSAWIGHPATIAQIEALTVADVTPLYQRDYWLPVGGDWLPNGLDLVTFDFGVNAGPVRAIRTLQSAVAAKADGIIGPATKAAVAASNAALAIGQFSTLRERYYESLATFPRFGRGWLARTDRVRAAALEMAG